MNATFNIIQHKAVSTKIADGAAWRLWADGSLNVADLPDIKPDVSFLPAILRRRLDLLSRLMFQAAFHLAEDLGDCPVVFVSHDGEINRSFEMYVSLLKDAMVSPNSFSLSVHNAAVGQWSVVRQFTGETVALAARRDGFECGVMESVSMLNDGAEKVLLIVADNPLSAEFSVTPYIRAPFAYAWAGVLAKGDDYALSFEPAQNADNGEYWGALNFIRAEEQGKKSFANKYQHGNWQWQVKR